jgi:hypothetical protein
MAAEHSECGNNLGPEGRGKHDGCSTHATSGHVTSREWIDVSRATGG